MSDYERSLHTRKQKLRNAAAALDEARADAFIDPEDEGRLQQAMEDVDDVLGKTEKELQVLEADWELVIEQCENILSLLDDAANQLDDDGLVTFDEHNGELYPVLDDEPDVITDTRKFIDRSIDQWWEAEQAAREVLEDSA